MGIAGVGMIISKYYQYAKKEEDLKGLRDIAYEIIDAASVGEVGIYWNGDTSMLFDGGILVFLTKVNELLNDKKIEIAIKHLLPRMIKENGLQDKEVNINYQNEVKVSEKVDLYINQIDSNIFVIHFLYLLYK